MLFLLVLKGSVAQVMGILLLKKLENELDNLLMVVPIYPVFLNIFILIIMYLNHSLFYLSLTQWSNPTTLCVQYAENLLDCLSLTYRFAADDVADDGLFPELHNN